VTSATALTPGAPVGVDIADAPLAWRRTEERHRVGRAAHEALATLDLSTGCDGSGRAADDVARASAVAQGVTNCGSEVATLVGRALSSPTVTDAARRRHWRQAY